MPPPSQYPYSFSCGSITNGRRSSNWSQVAALFPSVRLFCRNYSTDLHQNFTRYSGNSGSIYSCIHTALSHSVSECQIDNCKGDLPQNWLPWQRPLSYWQKKIGLIICNSIPNMWYKDCENRSSGSWDTLAPREQVRYKTKFVALATSFRYYKKIAKIGPVNPEIFHEIHRTMT